MNYKRFRVFVKEAEAGSNMPPFLEQDRPAKAKEVYRALKRDHPTMDAGKKARIANAMAKKAGAPQPPVSTKTQDFVAGLDPFGMLTSQYGQRAQRAGISEQEHAKKRRIGTVGGLVGGGIMLPAAISGTISGAGALGGGGSVGQRLARAGSAALSGATKPFRGLYQAAKAQRALGQAAQGQRLDPKQIEALKSIAGQARIGDVVGQSKAPGRLGSMLGALKARKELARLEKGYVNPEVAKALQPQIRAAAGEGLATLGMGAGVGGLGAYVQYGKGREAEKDFQARMGQKAASAIDYGRFREFLAQKEAAASKDPRLAKAGVSGYNQVKRTPGHPTKSHIVVAKEGDRVKTIRFGQQGVKTNQTAGQREAFKSRHRKNISKGKMSAAYWADKAKWSPKKTKDKDNPNWVKGS